MTAREVVKAARRIVRECVYEARWSMLENARTSGRWGWNEYGKAYGLWMALAILVRNTRVSDRDYWTLSRLASRAGRAFFFIRNGKLSPRHERKAVST